MGSLIRETIGDGFTSFLKGDKGSAGISFGILKLKDGAKGPFRGESGGYELGLVVLSGRCCVEVDGTGWGPIGSRDSVFSGKATAVYIPPHSRYEVSPAGIMDDPEFVETATKNLGVDLKYMNAIDFGRLIDAEDKLYEQIIKTKKLGDRYSH